VEYLRIKNWEKFQQYRDREPKWIKLHRALLRNYEFNKLPDTTKAHLILLWLLAAELHNQIPLDKDWIKSEIKAKSKIDFDALVSAGFISIYKQEGESVQNCTELYIEKRREEKRRGEGEPPKKRFLNYTLLTEEEHQKLINQLGEKLTTEYIEKVDSYVGSTGRRYKSHYMTILSWWQKDGKPGSSKVKPPDREAQRRRAEILAESKGRDD